ncbi:uncharacterized protein MELLADRAFT_104995 [Melampsora larici-populina 98AG31]|uniref:Uncharacterized protein n=1 Tax=Melampsora larici-populina (strain 98AG31 / pathotype 3-4-7) TaxID=747676 RepID=F4RG59_MELLP|nr:uncharacterized protein MELLADRAFT_104995 [Melampsora larici-populina 98AG31]EGG08554.1 hypothetical protein MELLADRAFT_104995 [Melampsora larici-populina 98AG31]
MEHSTLTYNHDQQVKAMSITDLRYLAGLKMADRNKQKMGYDINSQNLNILLGKDLKELLRCGAIKRNQIEQLNDCKATPLGLWSCWPGQINNGLGDPKKSVHDNEGLRKRYGGRIFDTFLVMWNHHGILQSADMKSSQFDIQLRYTRGMTYLEGAVPVPAQPGLYDPKSLRQWELRAVKPKI